MTTLISINTRDAVVMSTDSLGTMVKSWIDPTDLAAYFDLNDGIKVRLGPDGKPALGDLSQITRREVVCSHLANVEKILSLSPLEMGVMCAGIGYIGERSIKSLVSEFKARDKVFQTKQANYTLKSVAEKLLAFLRIFYTEQYKDEFRPELEPMLCGYDKRKYTPGMVRIYVHENRIKGPDYDLCLFMGGQTKGIQRLIFGIDADNKVRLMDRVDELLSKYNSLLTEQLVEQCVKVELKKPEDFGDKLRLFQDWEFDRMQANWGAFSEQSAIECADFLVSLMISSQKYSTDMVSVGGDVQIAVIKKGSGFTYVSRREWHHGENAVPALD
ncbi:MAG: hypothetical protein PHN78_07500 [Dehalococcoidales bacterium]|nr:hypothetical protein [Dehalococcoidales bacterium]